MRYRFKSQATAELVMLAHDGKRLLELWGKDPQAAGILLVADMAAAAAALIAEAEREEAAIEQAKADALAAGEPVPDVPPVSWRARVQPMIKTLGYCQAEDTPLHWEV